MSQKLIRGRNMTCDRCGTMDFLTEGQLDKGEHSWSRICLHDVKSKGKFYDLCPSCTDIYEDLTREFMNEVLDLPL